MRRTTSGPPAPAARLGQGRHRWRRFSLAAILLLALGFATQTPPAAAALAVRIAATANFGGNYAAEQWVPITIALANDGPGVSGAAIVEVPGGNPPLRFTQRVELPTRSQKVLTLYAQVPSRVSAINVRFEAGKENVLAAPVTLRDLRSGQGLVGVIIDDAAGGGELTRAIVAAYGTGIFEAITVAPDEITANTFGLGSFSALIVGDASTGRWSAEQRAALADWVARGGQLVVAGGPNWRKAVEGLGELPPLRPTDSRAVPALAGLATLGSGNAPTGQAIVATGDLLGGAARLAEQDGLPLVATRGWGHGTVTSLAFDPTTSALSNWSGAARFWRTLALDTPAPAPLQAPFIGGSYNSNYSNNSGTAEIIDVLRDIPGLALPPTWLLGLILFFFILAIGPANYLVLRAFDRRELAWITIPVLTLIFAGAIYAVGAATKGRSLVLNSASIVRVSPGARSAEVAAFYGIFTPTRGIRDINAAGEALMLPFSRGGLGESAELGNDVRFEQGAGSGVNGASFAQWTQRTIAAQGTIEPQTVALDVALRWEGQKIVGTVTNRTQLAVEDGLLVYNGGYQSIGSLPPGASATVDWRPTATSGTGYGRGLGTVYYGPQYQNNNSGSLGVTGRRANTLDALSGSVIDYRGRGYSPPPTPTATQTATPTPRLGTPPPGTPGSATPTRRTATPSTGSTAAAATNKPLQILFWRNDLPLDLKIVAGERYITTLVIQETYPGATTQDAPAPLALVGEGLGEGR